MLPVRTTSERANTGRERSPHAIVRDLRWNRGPVPVRTTRPSLRATAVVVVRRLFVLRGPPQRHCRGTRRGVGRPGGTWEAPVSADGRPTRPPRVRRSTSDRQGLRGRSL